MEKVNRKNRLVRHLGTARNLLEEKELLDTGQQFLDKERIKSGRLSLFDNRFEKSSLEDLFQRFEFIKALDTVVYDFFNYFYVKIGLNLLKDDCFRDLVLVRILNPVSKSRTRDFLERNLDRKYSLTAIYRGLQYFQRKNYQEKVENILWDFSQKQREAVSVLFFDVTTLYFEAFDGDEFRRCGFSKDNKANQPQVMVTLAVTSSGFPLHLRSFSGNKFEGHTIIPCMLNIEEKHHLDDLIIVADSAMVSAANMEELEKHQLKFIVGARLSNLSRTIFQKVISNVSKIDGETKRFSLNNNRVLVVSYSLKRAQKDKSERVKQLKRASYALKTPSLVSRSFKFLRKTKYGDFSLNKNLVLKSEQLEGLKGYITNAINLSNEEIVQKYSQLWQVEKSFRMSKSDLKARPIFHTAKEKIEAHLLIVFTALAVVRLAEDMTKNSCAKILEKLNPVKQIIIEDRLTKKKIPKYVLASDEAKILTQLARLDWVT